MPSFENELQEVRSGVDTPVIMRMTVTHTICDTETNFPAFYAMNPTYPCLFCDASFPKEDFTDYVA